MLKGNWERRAELAESRRKEAKEKKFARSAKVVSVKSIISYLQKNITADTLLTVWICDSDKVVCSHYLRQGLCENRKCRYPHKPFSTELSKSVGITFSDIFHIGKDMSCEEPIIHSLWDIPPDRMESIKFISVSDENVRLIYDHLTPHVWNEYKMKLQLDNHVDTIRNVGGSIISNSCNTIAISTQFPLTLPCIHEGSIVHNHSGINDDDEASDDSDEKEYQNEDIVICQLQDLHFHDLSLSDHNLTSAMTSLFLPTISTCAFWLATYLNDRDLVSLFLLSK